MSKIRFVLIAALVTLLSACAPSTNQLQVNDSWARPGLSGGNSAVFFVIVNQTARADTLLSVSSDVAYAVEVHKTVMQDSNMHMEHQQEVSVQVGKTEFKPGGLHVMLIGLNRDLNQGDTFSVTLNFAAAGSIPLDVTVSEP